MAAIECSFANVSRHGPREADVPCPSGCCALELLNTNWVGRMRTSATVCTDFAVMYACGLREYQAPRSQVHFVLPETLCEFRGRIDEALMDELIAIQAAAMEEGLVSPAHLVIDTFPCETRQPTGHRCHHTV